MRKTANGVSGELVWWKILVPVVFYGVRGFQVSDNSCTFVTKRRVWLDIVALRGSDAIVGFNLSESVSKGTVVLIID